MEQLGSHWTDFREIWYLNIFRKYVEKVQVSLKFDKNNLYFIWRPMYIFLSPLAQFFLEWEMFQAKVVEKIKTQIFFMFTNTIFFFQNRAIYEVMLKKYCRARQARDDYTAHAHCMLDT